MGIGRRVGVGQMMMWSNIFVQNVTGGVEEMAPLLKELVALAEDIGLTTTPMVVRDHLYLHFQEF